MKQAREALAGGMCAVIGLQTTGESAEGGLELAPGMRVDGFVSTTREMLCAFIRNYFPVHIADVAASGGCGRRASFLPRHRHPPRFRSSVLKNTLSDIL